VDERSGLRGHLLVTNAEINNAFDHKKGLVPIMLVWGRPRPFWTLLQKYLIPFGYLLGREYGYLFADDIECAWPIIGR
jgi:hypothetical protein